MTTSIPIEYKFIEEGNEIKIPIEKWGWMAIYKDGTFLKQFDEVTGMFHQFKEINQAELDTFAMQSFENQDQRFEIHMEEGMTPIHYYRVMNLDFGTPNQRRIRLYCFGFKQVVEGKSVKTIMQIHPNGAVAIKNGDGRPD